MIDAVVVHAAVRGAHALAQRGAYLRSLLADLLEQLCSPRARPHRPCRR
jgi:hypothetical protein